MINMLYHAHSGLRYLVLLLGVAAVLYSIYAYSTRQTDRSAGRILTSAYVGVLDVQVLIGIFLVIAGIYYPALIGHLAMMVLAAVVAHAASVLAKKEADLRRAHGFRVLGIAFSLLLIVGGIMAIGRGILETRAPMIGS